MADVPSRVDRSTFDRVLQRAAELQAASKDIGDGLTEDEVLALGTEVGIPTAHLQQALLEERTRATVPAPSGVLDHMFGPAEFIAQRVVQGTPESVRSALNTWLSRQEHLVEQRTAGTRTTWEPMEAFARGMRRLSSAFSGSQGKPFLDKAELVTAVITPLESGFCHVTLAATLRRARSNLVGGGTALVAIGMGLGGMVVLIGATPIAALLPFIPATIAGAAVARSFSRQAARAQLGLERALDELERHPLLPGEKGGSKGTLARGVGQVVREIRQEVRKALEE